MGNGIYLENETKQDVEIWLHIKRKATTHVQYDICDQWIVDITIYNQL